ncbi:MAG TPA: glycine--tRNA ligase subunit beta [Vicinamibacterales bacterium]|nr:glycine--tRNA ligase subunit beta [Vicinamibacterales bacterium]
MDRELLLEIGCEELPASWLPALTNQIGEIVDAQLRAHRLPPESPVETYSTPRRLTVRIVRIPERQSDLEELVNGPPVSAAFRPDGTPTPAAAGFASKQGVEVSGLERLHTPKGEYLAFRKRQRGRATVDVLPDVLRDWLRGLPFPKAMHWDAMLDDGKGDLLFGRPIRWILYLYGGRVVPFAIGRTTTAQTSQVQDVPSGAVTYGHRFLTTSGRAGRAIKVRSFDEYRARLLENFVILERAERHNKIARELDAKAQRLQGRVSRTVNHETGLLLEVPDLVEYPSVVAGTFALEFLELPEEVLTTTLIHHQHYFPVEGDDGKLKNAFLAVINTEPDNERTIARNAERVVSARLRDARFFWEADRKIPLASRIDRLGTLLFHRKLGTYREKAERIEKLAGWIAKEMFGESDVVEKHAATAARLAKTDLATDMVREFTELQGTMGGIYARTEGHAEEVWKAIYYHYLPIGVESDAAPSRAQLGKASLTWAAVSLADKFDTLVGMFAAGERPTGSRDPFGLRRAAHGALKILTDISTLTAKRIDISVVSEGSLHIESVVPPVQLLIDRAAREFPDLPNVGWRDALAEFIRERQAHVFERRGFETGEIKAISEHWMDPALSLRCIEAVSKYRSSADFQAMGALFKRIKNITKDADGLSGTTLEELKSRLREPAELVLADEIGRRGPAIQQALMDGRFADVMDEIVAFKKPVDDFFRDVLVMTEEPSLREARLAFLVRLRKQILLFADPSAVVQDERQA